MRKALESVLFFDETTPVKELIGRCANEPLHLLGEASTLHRRTRLNLFPMAPSAIVLPSCWLDLPFVRARRRPATVGPCAAPAERASTGFSFDAHIVRGVSLLAFLRHIDQDSHPSRRYGGKCPTRRFRRCASSIATCPLRSSASAHRNVRWNKLTCYPRRVRYSVSEEEHVVLGKRRLAAQRRRQNPCGAELSLFRHRLHPGRYRCDPTGCVHAHAPSSKNHPLPRFSRNGRRFGGRIHGVDVQTGRKPCAKHPRARRVHRVPRRRRGRRHRVRQGGRHRFAYPIMPPRP